MPKAAIVYWFSGQDLRPDGGGLRVMAWERALRELGYDADVIPLGVLGTSARGSRLSALKRSIIPMPLVRRLPDEALDSDLVVATVPAVFLDAVKRVPRQRLVLDWMDRWSINARTIGDARLVSRLGGRLQSRIWDRRERRLAALPGANTYAGWGDCEATRGSHDGAGLWLPTPVPLQSTERRDAEIRVIGFIGNLNYPPNQLSLRNFLNQHGEALAARGIEIAVAGFGSDVVRGWGHEVTVMGAVGDVSEFYRYIDAAVVPIEHGGGIKVKAVEAMSFGVPVYATDHVRSGFSRDFAAYLPDLDEVVADTGRPVAAIDKELFRSVFTQEAFVDGVIRSLEMARTKH